jgi:hypothetical protein
MTIGAKRYAGEWAVSNYSPNSRMHRWWDSPSDVRVVKSHCGRVVFCESLLGETEAMGYCKVCEKTRMGMKENP